MKTNICLQHKVIAFKDAEWRGQTLYPNIEKADVEVQKEMRTVSAAAAAKREYTEEQIQACPIDALRNGGTCAACQ